MGVRGARRGPSRHGGGAAAPRGALRRRRLRAGGRSLPRRGRSPRAPTRLPPPRRGAAGAAEVSPKVQPRPGWSRSAPLPPPSLPPAPPRPAPPRSGPDPPPACPPPRRGGAAGRAGAGRCGEGSFMRREAGGSRSCGRLRGETGTTRAGAEGGEAKERSRGGRRRRKASGGRGAAIVPHLPPAGTRGAAEPRSSLPAA